MAKEVRKYWVKESMRFNMDSMRTSVLLRLYDMADGKIDKVTILGEEMDRSRLYDFLDELEDLQGKAQFGKVTGKEYGRIKAISDERNLWRYAKCIEAGMSDSQAGYAFFD